MCYIMLSIGNFTGYRKYTIVSTNILPGQCHTLPIRPMRGGSQLLDAQRNLQVHSQVHAKHKTDAFTLSFGAAPDGTTPGQWEILTKPDLKKTENHKDIFAYLHNIHKHLNALTYDSGAQCLHFISHNGLEAKLFLRCSLLDSAQFIDAFTHAASITHWLYWDGADGIALHTPPSREYDNGLFYYLDRVELPGNWRAHLS